MTVSIDAFSAGDVVGGWRSGVLGRAADLDGFGSPTNDPPVTVNQGFGFITIGASATALLLAVSMASQMHAANDPGTLTVTVNPLGTPQVMTQLGPVVNNAGGFDDSPTYLFGLVNPASGLTNIQINWTNHTNIQEFYVYAMSFTGTATTSVADAFYGFATANDGGVATQFNGVSTSAAVRSGDMAFSIHINDINGPGFDDPALNATGIEMDRDQAVSNNSYGQYFNGTGSVILAQADNFNASFGSSGFWCAAVVAIGTAPTGTTVNLTGAGMTSGAGSLIKTIVKPFIGAGATGAAGSFTNTILKPFTGVALASGAGSLNETLIKALTGAGILSAGGSLAVVIAKALTGVGLTSGAGSFSVSAGSNITVNLVGVGLTSGAGLFTIAIVTPFAGVGLTSAAGIVTPISGLVVPLSGAGLLSGAGSLARAISSALAGAGLVSAPGSIIAAPSILLPGAGSMATAGTIARAISAALAGVALVSASGILVPSGAIKTAVLTGVSATISAGVLTVTISAVTLPVPAERIVAISVELRVVFPVE